MFDWTRTLLLGTTLLLAANCGNSSPDHSPPDSATPDSATTVHSPGAPTEDAAALGRGLVRSTAGADSGYTLFAPLRSTTTYLIDSKGRVVHSWPSPTTPGAAVVLLDSGRLLRCGREPRAVVFSGGGAGGWIQEIDWSGVVTWEFRFADPTRLQHHDLEPLPNGNVLIVAWERKTSLEAIRAGRHPDTMRRSELWPDFVAEVEPQRPSGGRIVWEWHVWDHLIQDLDPSMDHHGVVAAHPERIDINADLPADGPGVPSSTLSDEETARLVALGYLASGTRREPLADWNHCNSIDYDPVHDRIVLSVRRFHELWVIDHSTSVEEAASSAGGRSGKGGDLLFRWGNPANYDHGGPEDRRLFEQHDVHWIAEGLPGAGHLLLFNNGIERGYSSVDEIALPVDAQGAFLGAETWVDRTRLHWSYQAPVPGDFFAGHLSSAQRLHNGSTLICDGVASRFFEVTAESEIVWDYLSPFGVDQAQSEHPGGVFRATRIPADHPGLSGRELLPQH